MITSYRLNQQKLGFSKLLTHYGKEVSTDLTCTVKYSSGNVILHTVMEMLEKRTQDYEVQLTRTIDELKTTKEQLVKITTQEAALVQQNAKMSVELVAQENSQKKLKSEMKCVKEQLKSRETELGKMKEEAGKMKTKHQGTEESLEKELEEKNKTLKDYQEKVQGYYNMEPPNKGHIGDNINMSAGLSFVERLSSFSSILCREVYYTVSISRRVRYQRVFLHNKNIIMYTT